MFATFGKIQQNQKMIHTSASTTLSLKGGKDTLNFHRAFRPIIIMAQLFGVFPISGITSPNSSNLRFSWKSWICLYCSLPIIGSATMCILSTTHLNLSTIGGIFFYTSATVIMLFFFKLAYNWPKLVNEWEEMERKLAIKYNYSKFNLKIRIFTVVFMFLASLEHISGVLASYYESKKAIEQHKENGTDILKSYFLNTYQVIFNDDNYAIWKGLIIQITALITTLAWQFGDLFLILISFALYHQYLLLNSKLRSTSEKAPAWWQKARIDYNRLAMMTQLVDSKIGDLILVSFTANFYHICIQIHNAFKPFDKTSNKVWTTGSFIFLISKTLAVAYSASNVHEESQATAPILFKIYSTHPSIEIERFLTHVVSSKICLTGRKFFSVTRSFILSVASTITTYEIILIQFDSQRHVDATQ